MRPPEPDPTVLINDPGSDGSHVNFDLDAQNVSLEPNNSGLPNGPPTTDALILDNSFVGSRVKKRRLNKCQACFQPYRKSGADLPSHPSDNSSGHKS